MTLGTADAPHIPFYIIVFGPIEIANFGASAFLQFLSNELFHLCYFRDFLS